MSLVLLLMGAQVMDAHRAPTQSGYSTKVTRQILDRFGRCVVKGQRARASEAILGNVDNQELRSRYAKLLDGDCLVHAAEVGGASGTIQAQFRVDQYRYAVADALVRLDLAGSAAQHFDGVPRLDHRDPGEAPAKVDKKGKPLRASRYEALMRGYDTARAANLLSRYGECVARLDPARTRALLMSEVETPQEAAAFAGLKETFGTCIPEGVTLTFSKVTLRGTIAVNYYRLSKAALGLTQAGAVK